MEARILGAEQIRSAESDWDRLLLRCAAPSPFCSLDFILPWMDLYGGEYDPLVIGIFDGGEARGFMPLASARGFLGGRALSFCASLELCSDHIDIVAPEEDAPGCLEAAVGFLSGDGPGWDELDISLVSEGSALFRHAPALGWDVTERSVAPCIDLSAGFDKYMSGFNGKHRYTLRKKARRLSELGFSYASAGPGDMDAGIETLFELHRLRAASKGIKSSFAGDRKRELHKAAARNLASKGRLWLRFLERDGEKIGAFYGFELGARLFYYQFGIEPEWEPFSPGTVLMHKVIEEAFSKGLCEFDFLRGAEDYKYGWANGARKLYSLRAYKSGVRGELSRTASVSRDFLKRNVRRLMG